MADCPLADECPSFSERIEGMGCQYYGDRGGKEWCNHYNQPIEDLKTAPVVPGEEVVVDVTDLHESGAGVGHHEDSGFVVLVDGVLPEARARVRITTVKPNYARGEVVERLPDEPEGEGEDGADGGADADTDAEATDEDGEEESGGRERQRLGSRDNFWGQ
ncbi:MAG: TRAM domain-containing protein [Halobacteriaceae archaeon]